MVKFLDLQAQYRRLKPEMDAAIQNILENATFIGGKPCQDFEDQFAKLHETKFCLGVANGTDALEIAIEALNLPKNSEIIAPANSFIASSECITRSGHTVVFCDCDPDTYTLSIPSLTSKITPQTKAIIAVHLYGHPCNMDAIHAIAKPKGIKVIEDCAQAHLATYKGRSIGSLGDIAAFSFYPGKNLGAYGDAGAILTNDPELAKRCKMIANHGRIDKYDHVFEGRNSRLDSLQAAVLLVKLPHLAEWTQTRRNLAAHYTTHLQNIPGLVLPQTADWANPAFHLFVIRTPHRDALQAHLAQHRIETGIHYPIALPKLKAYAHLKEDFSSLFAYQNDTQLLSLPIGDHLTLEDIQEVCTAIRSFFTPA